MFKKQITFKSVLTTFLFLLFCCILFLLFSCGCSPILNKNVLLQNKIIVAPTKIRFGDITLSYAESTWQSEVLDRDNLQLKNFTKKQILLISKKSCYHYANDCDQLLIDSIIDIKEKVSSFGVVTINGIEYFLIKSKIDQVSVDLYILQFNDDFYFFTCGATSLDSNECKEVLSSLEFNT